MSKNFATRAVCILFFATAIVFTHNDLNGQLLKLGDFTIFAGPNGTGTTLIGSSITINNGSVGATKLVQTTGNVTINANIFSGDKISLTNSNIVTGKIAAGNSSNSPGYILTVGSSAILGDAIADSINVKGSINIGGGSVAGAVTLSGPTYIGPTPGAGPFYVTPNIPILPTMPAPSSITGGAGIITTNQTYIPGTYGTINYSGNKTLTLKGPGNYYFKAFNWTGNSNKLVFDFNGSSGKYYIYIEGNADFGKLNASTIGGAAEKILMETTGDGVGTSIPGYSFIIANGSSGSGSKWYGTVYASRAGISIGSGTGSSTLTGALYSISNVSIQSGVTVNYAPFTFCDPVTANAGPDQTGAATCGLTTVTLAANNPAPGTGQWSVVSGPAGYSFSNISSPSSTFSGPAGAAYTLRWTITNPPCDPSTDDVNIAFNRNPTQSNAGPDQINSATCGLTSVTLAANTPTVGTGSWSIVTGTGGSFGNASSPTSTFSGTAGNTYTLRWTITNSPCPASTDDVTVTFNTYPATVNAGIDKALPVIGTVVLTGTTNAVNPSYNWTTTDGVILTTPTTQAQITVASAGIYTFTVTNAAGCSKSDDVKVTSRLRKIIGSELQSIYDNYGPGSPPIDTAFFNIQNGYVSIDIICLVDTNIVLNLLRQPQYGLINIIPNGLSKHTVTGDYPILNLPGLDTLQNLLNFCRPYYRPFTNAGVTLTQGDTTMRTYLVRKGYSVDGTGYKIGVLSDSYGTILSGTTATLPLQPVTDPPNPIPQTFNTNTAAQDQTNGDVNNVQVLLDFPIRKSDEGRAMINIIGDVAPGAQAAFRTGFFTPGDFAQGVKELKNAGCQIIVDDITFITEPMLKDGVAAKTVNEVKAQGVSYFSAAGNFSNRSYESPFNPTSADDIGFPGKTAHNFGGGDRFQHIRLAPGNYTFVLQWVDNIFTADDLGTQFDIDFYLTKQTNGTGLIGFNRDNALGDPIEFIPIYIPPGSGPFGDSTDYNILIVNNTVTGNPDRVKYVVYKGGIKIMEYNIGASTIVGQANAEGAIAIGAARFNHVPGHPLLPSSLIGITKPQIESFSSVGGTYVTDALGVQTQRLKPDLVGPDGGNTTVKMGQDYPNNALDGWSNFFGTSAAAPHAAAAAAVVMQGRKKFLIGHPETTPDQIKTLFQSTAVDMRPAGLIGYDFHSGAGLIDADAAMRTFASPTPFEIKLVKPTNIIPCQDPFVLTIVGENFSSNSIVYLVEQPGDSIILTPSYISDDTILVTINSCIGNPEILVYTPPKTTFGDGGFSNAIKLFSKQIVVQTVNVSKKYGQANPIPSTTITVDGVPLEQTALTRTILGLDSVQLNIVETPATINSNVGTYTIKVSRAFDNTNPTDLALTNSYRYLFKGGLLSVGKLPLKVTPNDITANYGESISSNITFKYEFDPLYPPANAAALKDTAKKYHNAFLPANALAVVNGFKTPQAGGYILSDADLVNLNMMTSFKALKNSRKFKLENGKLVPRANTDSLDSYYLLDIASKSIFEYKGNSSVTNFYEGYPGYSKKGLLNEAALSNGNGQAITTNGLVSMINGNLAPMLNGTLASYLNGGLATYLNASLAPMINGNLVSYLNGSLATLLNGVPTPIPNSPLVYMLNGNLVYYLNGGLAPIINGGLVTLLNGQTITITDANSYVIIPNTNNTGVLKLTNGGLAQYLNGNLAPLINAQNVVVANGGLATYLNGTTLVPLINGQLVFFLNGGLATYLNGTTLVPIINSGLATLLNTTLVSFLNGTLVSYLNTDGGSSSSTPNNTAVIIDETDVDATTNNYLGALFGINMITGLNAGTQTIVPAVLVNPNFDISYGLGHATINKATVTVTADNKTKQYADANPPLTVTYTGFQYGETLATSGITGSPSLSTTATVSSPEGTYPITVSQGSLGSANYAFNYVNGALTITSNPCLLTHGAAKNLTNTTQVSTSMWLSMTTKVSGQLSANGDYLLFKAGTISFNFVNSTPIITDFSVPNGKIVADNTVSAPVTSYDAATNTWITKVPVGFASTSDIFVTGALINSSNGFVKLGGNTNSVLKGMFFSNKNFSDQWGYALAPYQPANNYTIFAHDGDVVSINGNYRAGTPIPLIPYYVGGGNSYTGTSSNFENFTACIATTQQNRQINTSEVLITQSNNGSRSILEPSVVIYPNPASESITLSIVPSQTGNARIEVYTMNGTKVMETNDGIYEAGARYLKRLNVGKLVNGMYLVRIWNGSNITNQKIVINR